MAPANPTPPPEDSRPAVVLGAGYAGLAVAQEIDRRSRGRFPSCSSTEIRSTSSGTELYEVGKLAASGEDTDRWTVPLAQVLDRTSVSVRQGEVRSVDLERRVVSLDTGDLGFRVLAICLGNVAAYYGFRARPSTRIRCTDSPGRSSSPRRYGRSKRSRPRCPRSGALESSWSGAGRPVPSSPQRSRPPIGGS